MARIRTIKPEAFQSESLGNVSLGAERTFYGLWTIADDKGRHRDQAAVINGALWPLRPEHTAEDLELELKELEAEDCICRYVGCDGKRYVHVVHWDHQKIDHPSKSRLPPCLEHARKDQQDGKGECPKHGAECPGPPEQSTQLPGPSSNPRETSRDLREDDAKVHGSLDENSANAETEGQGDLDESSRKPREDDANPQGALDVGPRTVGPRTEDHVPPSAAARAKPETPNQRANRLAQIYTDQVKPSNFPAVAKIVKKAVDANCADDLIVAGLQRVIYENRSLTTESLRIAMYGKPRQARSPGADPDQFTAEEYTNGRF